jgi:ABC-2 type transport system permease protein
VDLLPESLSTVAYMFPLAPTLEAMRLSLFAGAGFADVTQELAVLAAFTGVVGVAAVWSFGYALRLARRQGSLSHY